MKRALTFLIMAAMAFTAVSCGQTDESAADTEAVEATIEETTADEIEEIIKTIEASIPVYDKHAGINIKAEPLPDTEDIPSDWHEVSNGRISFMVPADVEYDKFEYDLEDGSTYKSEYARSEDRRISIMFFDGNNWKEKESETEDYDVGESLKEVYDSLNDEDIERIKQVYIDKGYCEPLDDSEENITENMTKLGFEYDGTRESLYRNLLEFSEDMLTDDNGEAFEFMAQLKAVVLGMSYPGIYYTETDGRPVYIHQYSGASYDPSKEKKSEYKAVWVGAFASPDMEYTALVRGSSPEETLQIASTIKIVE